ncbi:hypothetical protein F7R25_03855 [Burkholderia stagnalis]|uniref:Uncharacterized protein n=1 Tax=Burkholderia stagnalis TaxID=1503054 RepID=A0A6L3N3Q5_9BURK|nr:hypothetical protein [Burkholderia stagnalis]KAB0640639.1 hypothetical protein F7R25_03855 [Burkholderia stagnalis]VWB05837.1 hypothetical protein BST28156_00087 [Burkholderia stagnalis]
MSEEKYMDEFARNEQENMAASRSHWDVALANELGIPTTIKSWKSNDRVIVSSPQKQKTKMDIVPWRDSFLPQWKVDLIEKEASMYDNMMKKLAQEHREKQAKAIENNLKGSTL